MAFIQPSTTKKNAFIESLNGMFIIEYLNQYWFRTLEEVKYEVEQYQKNTTMLYHIVH